MRCDFRYAAIVLFSVGWMGRCPGWETVDFVTVDVTDGQCDPHAF